MTKFEEFHAANAELDKRLTPEVLAPRFVECGHITNTSCSFDGVQMCTASQERDYILLIAYLRDQILQLRRARSND